MLLVPPDSRSAPRIPQKKKKVPISANPRGPGGKLSYKAFSTLSASQSYILSVPHPLTDMDGASPISRAGA